LEQSTLELIGMPMLTPHLPGMPAALPMLTPPRRPAMLLRQLHAAWRSALDDALLLRLLTPLQHPADGAEALPMAYARHGEMADVTSRQLIAADAVSAATSTARMATTMASRRVILLVIVIE
jgi:hypothetical protein